MEDDVIVRYPPELVELQSSCRQFPWVADGKHRACPICGERYWHMLPHLLRYHMKISGTKRDMRFFPVRGRCPCGFVGTANEMARHLGNDWEGHLRTYMALAAMREGV